MKGITDENFIPRWKKVAKKNETKECCVPGCTQVAKKVTRLVDIETIISLFADISAHEVKTQIKVQVCVQSIMVPFIDT